MADFNFLLHWFLILKRKFHILQSYQPHYTLWCTRICSRRRKDLHSILDDAKSWPGGRRFDPGIAKFINTSLKERKINNLPILSFKIRLYNRWSILFFIKQTILVSLIFIYTQTFLFLYLVIFKQKKCWYFGLSIFLVILYLGWIRNTSSGYV